VNRNSLGLGDCGLHELEDQLYEAIVESPFRAVIKNGIISLPDPNGSPGEAILVDPAGQDEVDYPEVLNLDES